MQHGADADLSDHLKYAGESMCLEATLETDTAALGTEVLVMAGCVGGVRYDGEDDYNNIDDDNINSEDDNYR